MTAAFRAALDAAQDRLSDEIRARHEAEERAASAEGANRLLRSELTTAARLRDEELRGYTEAQHALNLIAIAVGAESGPGAADIEGAERRRWADAVKRVQSAELILADIRGEIVTLTGHRDSRSRGGQHVGTGGRLSSAPPGVERVLREWLAKIDGTMPPAPPLPGPTAEDLAHHARVSQKGANAVRWQANVEPLIEAVASLRWVVERHNTLDAPCLCSRCKLSDAIEKLATTAKEADRG